MIDIENQLFDGVSRLLEEKFSGIFVTNDELQISSIFPAVSFEETDNYTAQNYDDSGDDEAYATIVYTINIYSNKTTGKKREVKEILKIVDDYMLKLGFVRLSTEPIRFNNATVYRVLTRYRAVVSKDKHIYRR